MATTRDYTVRKTMGEWTVCRDDGSYLEFLDRVEAQAAADSLADGTTNEDEYEWQEIE